MSLDPQQTVFEWMLSMIYKAKAEFANSAVLYRSICVTACIRPQTILTL